MNECISWMNSNRFYQMNRSNAGPLSLQYSHSHGGAARAAEVLQPKLDTWSLMCRSKYTCQLQMSTCNHCLMWKVVVQTATPHKAPISWSTMRNELIQHQTTTSVSILATAAAEDELMSMGSFLALFQALSPQLRRPFQVCVRMNIW